MLRLQRQILSEPLSSANGFWTAAETRLFALAEQGTGMLTTLPATFIFWSRMFCSFCLADLHVFSIFVPCPVSPFTQTLFECFVAKDKKNRALSNHVIISQMVH